MRVPGWILICLLVNAVPFEAHALECGVDGPEYYAVDLVPTRNLPGLARAGGTGELTYAASPFGISLTAGGRYAYHAEIQAAHLPNRSDGRYVAWISTPDLDSVVRIGPLDEHLRADGHVTFNKFLVFVTFEPLDELENNRGAVETGTTGTAWKGPVILRGLSRSGLMHTMAGHGPFRSEPCAKYGY